MGNRKKKYIKVKVARSAKTGRFVTKRHAKRSPHTTVIETVRKKKK